MVQTLIIISILLVITMKKKWLKIAALVVAFVIIAGLCVFANALVGNPLSKWLATRTAKAHLEEVYGDTDFVIEKILLKVEKDKLDVQICNELFERDYSAIAEQIHSYRLAQAEKRSKRIRRKSGKRTMLKSIRKKRTFND